MFFIVMSHGDEDEIYGIDERKINNMDIVREFSTSRCPTLQGKPKIFMFQACRGMHLDKAQEVEYMETTDGVRDTYPDLCDILLIYPTSPGYVTWRNHKRGAWYI